MTKAYKRIAECCVKKILASKKRPLLAVITGDSGSGKSYYAKLTTKELANKGVDFTYVDADDFLIPRQEREPMKKKFYQSGKFKGKSYYEVLENMFRLDAFKQVIHDLRARKPTTYFPYSRSTGEVAEIPKTVEPHDIVIFDSSMLAHLFDVVILIEVSRENILKRKIKRDADIRSASEVIDMHQKVQGYYWDRSKPKNPDVIIDNNDIARPICVCQP
ncbi:MAG: hypothetical protein A3H70_02710 [Candidatus Komeilibacteria bacterium RIFCSPLOWO2_02_FULL_48_11]|uniref:Phosphoribulokinase/uridine kinase domain-containing protein n=1 Tax=Candidatus Komeilibacteria bacterium RIFCSPLOWO2_02_FULL_48_11 TaxID=1798553 RepID=A0A1G2BT05_9BACT|nr:MAG: hypothetical protein A3H70_02710 [Candidatus Komeilibacteria bacterium RIFCSPLOWO2_02_FULL_48_11]